MPSKKTGFKLLALSISCVAAFGMAEVVLRLGQAIGQARMRHIPDYGDTWKPHGSDFGPGGFLLENFQARVQNGSWGTVRWKNNSRGFRSDREFAPLAEPGVLRILSIGDSFTAGYRVDQEETFSRRLEVWSQQELGPTEVLISVVHSPAFSLRWLERFWEDWKPRVVLVGITLGNDVAENYLGIDDSNWAQIVGPDSEPLPAWARDGPDHPRDPWRRSFLYRFFRPRRAIAQMHWEIKLFDQAHGLGIFLSSPPPLVVEVYSRLAETLRRTREWASGRDVSVVFLVFPQRFQVQPPDWDAAVWNYSLKPELFDLTAPNRFIAEVCRTEQLECFDLTEPLARDYRSRQEDFYLPNGDMHWNREGNRVVYEALKEYLRPILEKRFAETRP